VVLTLQPLQELQGDWATALTEVQLRQLLTPLASAVKAGVAASTSSSTVGKSVPSVVTVSSSSSKAAAASPTTNDWTAALRALRVLAPVLRSSSSMHQVLVLEFELVELLLVILSMPLSRLPAIQTAADVDALAPLIAFATSVGKMYGSRWITVSASVELPRDER
jgi:hypothetical protein